MAPLPPPSLTIVNACVVLGCFACGALLGGVGALSVRAVSHRPPPAAMSTAATRPPQDVVR